MLGMGVAFQLLRAGYKHVTIVADKFSPDTTSDVAGASIVVGLTARSSAAAAAATTSIAAAWCSLDDTIAVRAQQLS